MSTSDPAHFQTTLHQAAGMNATGIIIPPEIVDQLARVNEPSSGCQ